MVHHEAEAARLLEEETLSSQNQAPDEFTFRHGLDESILPALKELQVSAVYDRRQHDRVMN